MRATIYSRPCFALILLLLASGWRGFAAVPSAVVTDTNIPMQIVTCRDGVDVDALLTEHGIAPRHRYHALGGFAARIPPGLIERLRKDSRVEAVEADGIANLCDSQITPAGVIRIGVTNFPIGRSNGVAIPLDVGVAILDSGIDPHPDLPPCYTNYWTFGTDGSDSLGHGTSVAGVIAAQDNGYGVVGVAPGVRIWNVKVIGPPPYNTWSLAIAGMDYCTAHSNEIAVANISIGNSAGGAPYRAILAAVRRMVWLGGIVVVAAAGNDARDMAGQDGVFGNGDDALPAGLPDVMAVSAMDPMSDTIASFSNYSQIQRTNLNNTTYANNTVFSSGLAIDLSAPGVNILTTGVGSNYVTVSGTSFAAPHVAGLVALYIAANGRAEDQYGVYKIRQAIVDASLAQSQWRTNHTGDPDTNPEPLAMASLNWVPSTLPIAREPVSQTICTSNSVTFGVVAVGSTFTYQWQFNGTNLVDDGRIIGSTSNILVITNVVSGDAGNYRVSVADVMSNMAMSTTATLTVLPPNLVQNGNFELPIAGNWTVETGTHFLASASGLLVGAFNFHLPPNGKVFAFLNYSSDFPFDGTLGTNVVRLDLATPLVAGTNYNLFFLQSGFLDFRAPAQLIVSLAPTGFTNEVYNQTFIVASNADWTRQSANFTVPSNGLYSLRLKSIPGTVALIDDVNLTPAPAVVAPTLPVFQNISRVGNALQFSWSAGAGQIYQLQYKTNLNQPDWINLGTTITATNTTVSATDTLGPDPQRFYRVLVQ